MDAHGNTCLGEIHEQSSALASFPRCATPGTVECQRFDDMERGLAHFPQVELPVVHRFVPGMYIRETTLPKDTFLTSHIHMTEHPFIMSKGDISVWTEEGGVSRVQAPFTCITKPGTRRFIYAHEDTVVTTFHVTNETDVNKIGEQILMAHHDHVAEFELKNYFPTSKAHED